MSAAGGSERETPRAAIGFDAGTGALHLGATVLSADIAIDALPPGFETRAAQTVEVAGRRVSCRFAETDWRDDAPGENGRRVHLRLRFEDGVWVSAFCVLRGAGAAAHRHWLRRKFGAAEGVAAGCRWGVAEDRSGDCHAFVHNRHWR